MTTKKTPTEFPDYFAMLSAMAGPLKHVAEAFTSPAATAAAAQVMPSFDPVEIDKKIRDLETVLVWLRAQVGAVELSVKALEMQRDFLQSIKSASSEKPPDDASAKAMESTEPKDAASTFSQFASSLNPAKWAEKIMPAAASTPPVPATSPKPRATKRKTAVRKPRRV